MIRAKSFIAIGMVLCVVDAIAQVAAPPQAGIPGVIAAGAQVQLIRGGFKGLEGPVATPDGGLYFSDIPANRISKESGNVHYLAPNGDVLLLDDQIRRPNGLTLSLAEQTLYVDDTEGEYVYAFDVQSGGRVANKRRFVKLQDPEKGAEGPRSRADGMALDADGRLYVATASGVQVIDSKGRHLGTIRLPAVARNLAFGGSGRRTLYLTALEGLYRVSMLSQGPPGRAK